MRSLRKLNYFLIGQPGAGKSTLGAQLAARLKVDFVDIDRDVLEADFGGPVAKQLVKLGHDGFMEAEAAATSRFLDTLTPDSDTVVSMTGSNPMDTSVMDKCVDLGELVYLDMPNDQLTERLLARPTGTAEIVGFDSANPGEFYDQREPYYADFTRRVKFGRNETVEQSVDYLAKQLTHQHQFTSTRTDSSVDFEYAALSGLAPGGGLYLPSTTPPRLNLETLIALPFKERMIRLLEDLLPPRLFDQAHLETIIDRTYSSFPESGTPLVKLGDGLFLAELFHGPSASFKDFALHLFPHVLRGCQTGDVVTPTLICAATSGDTGGALLAGLDAAQLDGMHGLVLMPADGTSRVQREQMLSFGHNPNIRVLEIDADFDFCQSIVKRLLTEYADYFAGELFMQLTVANSISWPRIAAQIAMHTNVYCQAVHAGHVEFGEEIEYCIPSGNFGSMFAAYLARDLGVPLSKLHLATNENRVLVDVFATGEYTTKERQLIKTSSCAMDILTASNFERIISHLFGPERTAELYRQFAADGAYQLDHAELARLNSIDLSASCVDGATAAKVAVDIATKFNYQLCPHSAVGIAAQLSNPNKVIVAGTAHPGKFECDQMAAPNAHYKLTFDNVNTAQTVIPADYDTIVQLILDFASKRAFRGASSGAVC